MAVNGLRLKFQKFQNAIKDWIYMNVVNQINSNMCKAASPPEYEDHFSYLSLILLHLQ